MKDLRQSSSYADYMQRRGWIVIAISSTPIFVYIRRLPLLPVSAMKVQRFNDLPDFSAIERLAKKYQVLSVTLEPGDGLPVSPTQLESLMQKHGYRKSNSPFLPTETLRVNLKAGKRRLFENLKKDARASIRKARLQCQVKILPPEKIKVELFYSFWKRQAGGYIPSEFEFSSLLQAFGRRAFLVTASYKKELLAGAVILQSDDCAYYWWAVTSSPGRRRFAGYLVVWEAMKEAKRRGCRVFDLEGIFDERFPQLVGWKGFSAFKRKFGGEEVVYPPPFTRFFLPFAL